MQWSFLVSCFRRTIQRTGRAKQASLLSADADQVLINFQVQVPASDLWLTEELDLTSHAGKNIKLELVNQPSAWSYEAAYWAEIALVSQ